MGHPVTTNPFIIMLINMTIVFVVLFGLALMIRLIHVIDPTKKTEVKTDAQPSVAATPVVQVAPSVTQTNDNALIAVIAAAVAIYVNGEAKITMIRPVESFVWKNSGRLTGINNTVG